MSWFYSVSFYANQILVFQDKIISFHNCIHTGSEDDASHDMETELAGAREDLVETINAWVVKAINSKLKDMFNPQAEPQVVFFRKTSPVLYTGPADEEVLLETIMMYKDRCITDLTDTSFEHLTQVGTGATTGDWLVMFFKVNKFTYTYLQATLRIVAHHFSSRLTATLNLCLIYLEIK